MAQQDRALIHTVLTFFRIILTSVHIWAVMSVKVSVYKLIQLLSTPLVEGLHHEAATCWKSV